MSGAETRSGEVKDLAKKAVKVYTSPPSPLVAAVCTALVVASIAVMAIRLSIIERNLTERTTVYEKQAALIEQHLDEHRKIVYRNHALLLKNSELLSDELASHIEQVKEMQAVLDRIADKVGK